MSKELNLDKIHETYVPSEDAVQILVESGLALVGNEIAGSGKDAIIDSIIKLSGGFYERVPSRKTRDLRPGEVDGIDLIHTPLEDALKELEQRRYVEWQPLRGTEVNGTHMDDLKKRMDEGKLPIKDVEPKGQAVLRELNPDIKAICPLPDLSPYVDPFGLGNDTVWEMLLLDRESMHGRTFIDALYHAFNTDEQKYNLIARLKEAAKQVDVIKDLDLQNNPQTLFVVNRFGQLTDTGVLALSFLKAGRGISHEVGDNCPTPGQVIDHLGRVSDIASGALVRIS